MTVIERKVNTFDAQISEEQDVKDTKNTAVLAFITISFTLGMIMVMPMVPLYASSLGANEFLVGLLVATAPLTALVFGLPISSCAAYIGITRLMRTAFVVSTISGMLFAVANSPAMLIIPQMAFGMSISMFMPQMINYYYRISTPDTRQAMQGYNTAFQGIGALLGPIIAGLIGQYQGLSWIFIWYAGLSLSGYLIIRYLHPIDKIKPPRPMSEMALSSYRRAAGLIIEKESLQSALFFIILMVVMWQGLGNTIFPLFIEQQHTAIAMMVGILIATREFGAVVVRLLFSRICKYMSIKRILSISIALMAIGSIIIPLSANPIIIGAACLLVGMGLGPLLPGLNLLALDAVSSENGPLAMATTNSISQMSLLIMAPLLGALSGAYGFENTFYLAAGCSILALMIFVMIKMRGRK